MQLKIQDIVYLVFVIIFQIYSDQIILDKDNVSYYFFNIDQLTDIKDYFRI